MSYIRLNITDQQQTIHSEVHGSFGDVILAALTAEPETIEEMAWAVERFVTVDDKRPVFAGFVGCENLESYDAGIMVIDLAGRVIAADSTYSLPAYNGSVRMPDATVEYSEGNPEDVYVPYRLSPDWLIVRGMPEYEGVCRARRAARLASAPLDVRTVLYGKPLLEFIAREIYAAPDSKDEALFTNIHLQWLMTPREDLRGQTPREVLFAKRDFIDFDLHSRALQWSFTERCPAPLLLDSDAYRFAGIGTHEWVIYYYLVRHLLSECLGWRTTGKPENTAVAQLTKIAADWLETPQADFSGRIPARLIEWERKRLNLTMSAHEAMIDDGCPTCVAMAEDVTTPMFWHLDGCNMDEGFAFSWHTTLAEYEAEEKERAEFNRKFNEDWAAGKYRQTNDDAEFLPAEPDDKPQWVQ